MNVSAEARIIASFTLIVALVFGAWGALELLLTGPYMPMGSSGFGALLVTLVPCAATAVALQAVRLTEVAWAQTLGSAAVMLGALASLAAVFYYITRFL